MQLDHNSFCTIVVLTCEPMVAVSPSTHAVCVCKQSSGNEIPDKVPTDITLVLQFGTGVKIGLFTHVISFTTLDFRMLDVLCLSRIMVVTSTMSFPQSKSSFSTIFVLRALLR